MARAVAEAVEDKLRRDSCTRAAFAGLLADCVPIQPCCTPAYNDGLIGEHDRADDLVIMLNWVGGASSEPGNHRAAPCAAARSALYRAPSLSCDAVHFRLVEETTSC